jgi:hypothetical protein
MGMGTAAVRCDSVPCTGPLCLVPCDSGPVLLDALSPCMYVHALWQSYFCLVEVHKGLTSWAGLLHK